MERRCYCLTLSYDGTNYRGWQRLPGGQKTLQETVERCLGEIFGESIQIDGSGRTDTGVHAKGQVASFTANTMPVELVLRRLRHLLPPDIGALSLTYAPERFHARLWAKEKTYIYRIWNSAEPDVFGRRFRVRIPGVLDLEAMKQGAEQLLGEHDFASFCANPRIKKSTVRCLKALEIHREGEMLTFRLTADGFLHHMVRIIVGTLLEIGEGKRTADSVPALLAARRREMAGETAPAHGLCLEQVSYEIMKNIRGMVDKKA